MQNIEYIELFDLSVEDLKKALRELPAETVLVNVHYFNGSVNSWI